MAQGRPERNRRTDTAVRREGNRAGHVCGGVGSRHSSQASSEGRREKDEKLTLHRTPNSFMSTSLVKSPTLDTEHGKPDDARATRVLGTGLTSIEIT